jgi:transposase
VNVPEVRLPAAEVHIATTEDRDMITIGIDPHKSSVTAVACDPTGTQLASVRLAVTRDTSRRLLEWATVWPDRQWAVEGASGLGRGVAQQLAAAGQSVLDVPAKLAARARLLGSGSARKTDRIDAASVAAVARHNTRLRTVKAEDDSVVLRLLSERHDDVVSERTRSMNRLHALLRDLHPGGAPASLTTAHAGELLAGIRPVTPADIQRKAIARDILTDLRRLDRTIAAIDKDIRAAVTASGSTLTEIHGLGHVTAAKILGLTGDVRRFPDEGHFASYTGTAPIEASSGDVERHRLSRRGNRQLNAAIHVAAVCQIRDPGPGREHYRRKLAEAKTDKEARRSLKRRLSNVIYRRMIRDLEGRPHTGS